MDEAKAVWGSYVPAYLYRCLACGRPVEMDWTTKTFRCPKGHSFTMRRLVELMPCRSRRLSSVN